jgi:hypothetical protein
MDKEKLIEEVGNWYGTFRKENGKYILNNYREEFVYNTPEEALIDWLPTLEGSNEDDSTMWVEEIKFIKEKCVA